MIISFDSKKKMIISFIHLISLSLSPLLQHTSFLLHVHTVRVDNKDLYNITTTQKRKFIKYYPTNLFHHNYRRPIF